MCKRMLTLILLLCVFGSGCAVSQSQRLSSTQDEVTNTPRERRFVRAPRPYIGIPYFGIGGIGAGIGGVGGGGVCP